MLQPRNVKPRPARELEHPPNYEKYSGYSVSTWLTEEGTAMRRRAIEIDDDADAVLQDGTVGWRHHWRHGLIGCIRYWAGGSRANVAKMLVGLADYFGVKDEVGQQLDPQRDSIAAERAVARNIKGAVAGLKPHGGSVEEQRSEYGVVLAAAFGEPAKAHDPRGMTAKIGRYLEVPVGARYTKKADGSTEKREYASRKAQTKRAAFNALVEQQSFELGREPQVGDVVLSRGEYNAQSHREGMVGPRSGHG